MAHLTIEPLQWDPDPFVLNNILVTNNTDTTQIFSAFVGLPTTFSAPNFISGNVSISVTDGGRGDGATVATTEDRRFTQPRSTGSPSQRC